MRNLDRFQGCLVGGAIGDALGYPVEFMDVREIRWKYGTNGIVRYDLVNDVAEVSDDTQMTLFTAWGIMQGETSGSELAGGAGLWEAYKDWYLTQTSPPGPVKRWRSWLLRDDRLFARRAPGTTCMNVLAGRRCGTIESPVNDRKGCGGVMRVAPIGLYACGNRFDSPDDADMLGARAAAMTHGHELGYIPAAALVHIVRVLASGERGSVRYAVYGALEAVKRLFPDSNGTAELTRIVRKAIDLADHEHPHLTDSTVIGRIGGGWTAEEALAIAVYCALKYEDDFETAMVAAVNHSGDSDSTGSITGNILGARCGYDELPNFYKKNIELSDLILEVAEDLYYMCVKE